MTSAEEPRERPANHLEGQTSPYLRAHSNDPVAWVPWGERALRFARRTNRPLLVSIGYQSCHWCHVMQRESFSDQDTAGFINRHFVPVKVDRETRPDVDAFYLAYVNLSTGSGGWPMTVFATPDGDPFFGGTYFPRRASAGQSDFREVLDTVLRAWTLSRETTIESAGEAIDMLRETQAAASEPIDRATIEAAAAALRDFEDLDHGGFGTAPKFPQAPATTFLLAYADSTGETWPVELVRRAVLAMLRGGTFDQVGGGLFRYSTDAAWHVPHFEKMLYDQGLLLSTLAALHRLDPSPELLHYARSTHECLKRDLAREDGGFNAALDSETEGVEGGAYLWNATELETVLTAPEIELARRHLGIPDHEADPDLNVVLTRRAGREAEASAVDALLGRLLEVRASRPAPGVVDHAITSWNALAARGLLEAGAAFNDPEMTARGIETLTWLLDRVVQRRDVVHVEGDGSVADVHFLEDYAALAAACLSACQASGDFHYLGIAQELQSSAVRRFAADGGFRMCTGATALPFAPLEHADNALPSGASLLAENGARLAALGQIGGGDSARRAVDQLGRTARTVPYLAGHALAAAVAHERVLGESV